MLCSPLTRSGVLTLKVLLASRWRAQFHFPRKPLANLKLAVKSALFHKQDPRETGARAWLLVASKSFPSEFNNI